MRLESEKGELDLPNSTSMTIEMNHCDATLIRNLRDALAGGSNSTVFSQSVKN